MSAAALLLPCLIGCAQDDPDTILSVGRAIRIPPPPGMKFLSVADDGTSRVFQAIDPALRQRKYTGVAWIEVHDEAAAESAFAERQGRHLGADDTVGTARWRDAMVDALMGSRAPLPEGPDMYPFIERIPMPEDAVAEMAFIRTGESRWVVGDAVLKASGRTVILNVICRHPGDHGDLARVRQTLIDWIGLVRKANAPGGEGA